MNIPLLSHNAQIRYFFENNDDFIEQMELFMEREFDEPLRRYTPKIQEHREKLDGLVEIWRSEGMSENDISTKFWQHWNANGDVSDHQHYFFTKRFFEDNIYRSEILLLSGFLENFINTICKYHLLPKPIQASQVKKSKKGTRSNLEGLIRKLAKEAGISFEILWTKEFKELDRLMALRNIIAHNLVIVDAQRNLLSAYKNIEEFMMLNPEYDTLLITKDTARAFKDACRQALISIGPIIYPDATSS